jgi:hypothetical protein
MTKEGDIQIPSRVAAQALLSRLNEVASEDILNFAKGAERETLRRGRQEIMAIYLDSTSIESEGGVGGGK